MKKNIGKLFVSLTLGLSMLLASCATTVSVTVQRPAEIYLRGAESIAILPIMITSDYNARNNLQPKMSSFYPTREQKVIVDIVQDKFEDAFYNNSDLVLVSSISADKAIQKGKTCPSDAFIVGAITDLSSEVIKKENRKEEDDNVYITTEYSRNIKFTFRYKVFISETEEEVYSNYFYVNENTFNVDDVSKLKTEEEMLNYTLSSKFRDIVKSMQPYEYEKSLTLLKDKTKSNDMEKARSLAENNMIKKSCDMYLDIYKRTQMFEAGYNAALLLEAQYKLEEAKDIAEELVYHYSDKRAYRLLKDIKYEIEQSAKFKSQTSM